MIIEMLRAMIPEDMQREVCGVCGIEFELDVILVSAATDGPGAELGYLCDPCIARFGEWKAEQAVDHDWPSYADYLEAKKRYPELMFASSEELDQEDLKTPDEFGEHYVAVWIHREGAPLRPGGR